MLTLGNVINFLSDAVGLIQDHFAFNKIIPIYASIMIKIRILIKLNTNLTKTIVLYILFMSVSFYQGCP